MSKRRLSHYSCPLSRLRLAFGSVHPMNGRYPAAPAGALALASRRVPRTPPAAAEAATASGLGRWLLRCDTEGFVGRADILPQVGPEINSRLMPLAGTDGPRVRRQKGPAQQPCLASAPAARGVDQVAAFGYTIALTGPRKHLSDTHRAPGTGALTLTQQGADHETRDARGRSLRDRWRHGGDVRRHRSRTPRRQGGTDAGPSCAGRQRLQRVPGRYPRRRQDGGASAPARDRPPGGAAAREPIPEPAGGLLDPGHPLLREGAV